MNKRKGTGTVKLSGIREGEHDFTSGSAEFRNVEYEVEDSKEDRKWNDIFNFTPGLIMQDQINGSGFYQNTKSDAGTFVMSKGKPALSEDGFLAFSPAVAAQHQIRPVLSGLEARWWMSLERTYLIEWDLVLSMKSKDEWFVGWEIWGPGSGHSKENAQPVISLLRINGRWSIRVNAGDRINNKPVAASISLGHPLSYSAGSCIIHHSRSNGWIEIVGSDEYYVGSTALHGGSSHGGLCNFGFYGSSGGRVDFSKFRLAIESGLAQGYVVPDGRNPWNFSLQK